MSLCFTVEVIVLNKICHAVGLHFQNYVPGGMEGLESGAVALSGDCLRSGFLIWSLMFKSATAD